MDHSPNQTTQHVSSYAIEIESPLKLCLLLKPNNMRTLCITSTMLCSWRHKFLVLLILLLAFVVHVSEGSRLPNKEHYYWEQMLPKKQSSPSSSPSKGTNSHVFNTTSSSPLGPQNSHY
ncbi:hypothetical protein HN51_052548 [Arachis hypogaea]